MNLSDKFFLVDIDERFELAINRIKEISLNDNASDRFIEFFISESSHIIDVYEIYNKLNASGGEGSGVFDYKENELREMNRKMYSTLLENELSYCNPDYAEDKLGIYGGCLSFLSFELSQLPKLFFDDRMESITILLELFLQLYGMFDQDTTPTQSEVQDAIFYYAFDYVEYIAHRRMYETLVPDVTCTAYDIVMNYDLSDVRYLFDYGEYISDTEIKLAKYLNSLDQSEIDDMASVYVNGFIRGYETMRISMEKKNSVNIRYHIGQERIIRSAIKLFEEAGLRPILNRCATSRLVRRLTVNQGYESTSPSKQYEYDHRLDDRFFLNNRFIERRINATESAYSELKEYAEGFGGPAVIETFGEELFSPVVKESVEKYTDEQQELSIKMSGKLGELSNRFIPGDEYSFTIIAFPVPDIGDEFDGIFKETARINTLDNEKYKKIQQYIIDVLDKSDRAHIQGMNGNCTDLTVKLRKLEDPEKQTQFENCTADVNIPVGEVFTSPVLKGTEGLLNVSQVYLNGFSFRNLKLHFTDGVVSDYSCDNFISEEDAEAKGKRYIKENILFNHEFLPMGEFAIGTNTAAYTMARKYDILEKLPILIVEKTGPHFAVGDTCYSHMEDHKVYNPDGKEIISRENDFSLLRDTEPEKAYFNCHTDVTIPYSELGRLSVFGHDGTETDIIVNGRFVLPGTEALNEDLVDEF